MSSYHISISSSSLLVGGWWLVAWSVGWSVCHYFPEGWEVTLPLTLIGANNSNHKNIWFYNGFKTGEEAEEVIEEEEEEVDIDDYWGDKKQNDKKNDPVKQKVQMYLRRKATCSLQITKSDRTSVVRIAVRLSLLGALVLLVKHLCNRDQFPTPNQDVAPFPIS